MGQFVRQSQDVSCSENVVDLQLLRNQVSNSHFLRGEESLVLSISFFCLVFLSRYRGLTGVSSRPNLDWRSISFLAQVVFGGYNNSEWVLVGSAYTPGVMGAADKAASLMG